MGSRRQPAKSNRNDEPPSTPPGGKEFEKEFRSQVVDVILNCEVALLQLSERSGMPPATVATKLKKLESWGEQTREGIPPDERQEFLQRLEEVAKELML